MYFRVQKTNNDALLSLKKEMKGTCLPQASADKR
jgi:hypothetical protein